MLVEMIACITVNVKEHAACLAFDFCMWMGVQEIDIARSVCGGAFDGKGLFGSNELCSVSMELGSAEGGDSNDGIHNRGECLALMRMI